MLRRLAIAVLTAFYFSAIAAPIALTQEAQPTIEQQPDGTLRYAEDDHGNRVPDFSHCGYAGGEWAIPDVAAVVLVEPAEGDDGPRIQAAIDQVARRQAGAFGIRGAVQLAAGRFKVAGQIAIRRSGVVLRGAGATDTGTTIIATGLDRRALIVLGGTDGIEKRDETAQVVDEYVPVGATRIRVDRIESFRAGDYVFVTRPSTSEWITAVGADAFGVGWRPGSRDIRWDRKIMAIEEDALVLDAPITTAIDRRYGGATVQKYDRPGTVESVGLEDVRLKSVFGSANPHDEEHAWFGVVANHARDVWVRRVEFKHFAGAAVLLREGVSRATVEDCISVEPVSELGGYRRHTYFTQGQQTLFLRCWSEEGRHDFGVGHAAPGPNAFVNCYAARALGDSGPLESWASGVLYDNVRIDGAELRLENRWGSPPGAGWSAANCMLWQCQASTVRCFRPPTANNWAIGTWSEYAGDGVFEARSDFVQPLSLYEAQLRERLGDEAAKRAGPYLLDPIGSTNPTIEEARGFVAGSTQPAPQLVDVIRDHMLDAARRTSTSNKEAPLPEAPVDAIQSRQSKPLKITNGWLTIDGQVKTGKRLNPVWWRGTVRPDDARAFGPSITRFAPGRVGPGLTDELEEVANRKAADGTAAYDHHYGLWYDRRRDDHLMVRRADGDVAPPFYEQPFARTGRGRAWDGLSKYDLTKWNPWYWSRLRDFARLCDERGLVLIHQNYFQHNILEAGAHWADCPWRPENNVNDTGFPEPPPYVGDKRIFLAEQFYDVKHPRRRALHRGYIRQCLDAFADSTNVIQMTSAEYSGPQEFVEFWIDCIAEWEAEHGRDVIVGLSAPKNVQDSILANERRAKHVDVIDIRYWCYGKDGELYAPVGGVNLAPRQHLRQTKVKPGGFDAIARAVREYRTRFPDKAVTYFAEEHCPSERNGWAVLMGGGSLVDVRLPEELAKSVAQMTPLEGVVEHCWCLGRGIQEYLVSSAGGHGDDAVKVTLPAGKYHVTWIDEESGEELDGGELEGGEVSLSGESSAAWLRRK